MCYNETQKKQQEKKERMKQNSYFDSRTIQYNDWQIMIMFVQR